MAAGFPSTFPSSGGGGGPEPGDPAMYVGQSPEQGQAGAPATGPSPDFVRQIGRMGMQLKQTLQTLSGQHPEAAEEFRQAIKQIDGGIAKILTTNPQAANGPQAPRSV